MGLRDDASSVDDRLSRVTRRSAGDRLEAYATVRRRLVAVGSWRYRQDSLERSLDTPESSVSLSQGFSEPLKIGGVRIASRVSLFDLIAGGRSFALNNVFRCLLIFTEEFVCGAKGRAD
jgi:hypothetical protein